MEKHKRLLSYQQVPKRALSSLEKPWRVPFPQANYPGELVSLQPVCPRPSEQDLLCDPLICAV